MPNWCDNAVTLRNDDKSKIDALAAVLENKEDQQVLNHLRPNPAGEWQYDWSVANWGTKWDIGIIDWERRDDNEIWISFDSAWSPPTVIYDYLVEQGWDVDAVYHEPGMGYAGMYTNDGGDDYYEYDVTDPNFLDELPSDIIEFAGLEDSHREWMINQLEDDWADAERTEWIDATVAPVRDGWYEITTEGWDFTQFCEFKNGDWENWNTVAKWRGLAQDPDWDPVAELEKLKVEFDETKVD
mgnify:FL=1